MTCQANACRREPTQLVTWRLRGQFTSALVCGTHAQAIDAIVETIDGMTRTITPYPAAPSPTPKEQE